MTPEPNSGGFTPLYHLLPFETLGIVHAIDGGTGADLLATLTAALEPSDMHIDE